MKFLKEQDFKTYQMLSTSSLTVAEVINDKIICMKHSYSQYVDEAFYRKQFGQNFTKNWSSYPSKVVAVEIAWILQYEEGILFLEQIYQ
jgi:hypothetical protein